MVAKQKSSGKEISKEKNYLTLRKVLLMKTAKKKETKEINWAIPGQTISHEEFMAAIRKAEKGPFITIDEFEKRFEEWKRKRGV